jgi:hypothetical protein
MIIEKHAILPVQGIEIAVFLPALGNENLSQGAHTFTVDGKIQVFVVPAQGRFMRRLV